eukprot:6212976-Pleurochrysis_carterae.AAC.1
MSIALEAICIAVLHRGHELLEAVARQGHLDLDHLAPCATGWRPYRLAQCSTKRVQKPAGRNCCDGAWPYRPPWRPAPSSRRRPRSILSLVSRLKARSLSVPFYEAGVRWGGGCQTQT